MMRKRLRNSFGQTDETRLRSGFMVSSRSWCQQVPVSTSSTILPDHADWPETRPDDKAPPMRQRWRELGATHDVSRAPSARLASLTSPARSLEELKARPITAGCFVLAAAAKSSSLARQCLRLAKIDWWVWKVLGVLEKMTPCQAIQ